jgi:hypothetical protein
MIIAVCVASSALAFQVTTAPATKPTTRPAATKPAPASRPAAKAKEVDPLRAAMLELQREAQTALQQKKPFPREKSDYFQPGNPIEANALLKTLGSRINQSPRIDAYVKYQLLSAVEKFDGEQSLDALKAYVLGSPSLIALPGTTQQEQQKWTQKALTAKQDDVEAINKEWNETLAPFIEANAIIIAYRDAMKAKIEVPDELKHKYFQAYLEDLSQRAAAGFEIDKELNAISKTIIAWGHLAKKSQINDMLGALKEYAARKPPKFYEKLSWRAKDKEAYWTYHYAGLSVTKVEKIQAELETALNNATE